MIYLFNKTANKILLETVLLLGIVYFWTSNSYLVTTFLITIMGLLAFILIILENAPIFILIYLSFLTSFSLYSFLFQFNLPVWVIMILILILFGYFFYYTEQKIGILGNKRLAYLILFSLIVLEVFFALNYFLISPLSKSLIISTIIYLLIGFCYTILAKHDDKRLKTYLIIATIMIGVVFTSSIWGNSI